jgi:hypothetical protein
VKDLSDLQPEPGAALLEEILELPQTEITIVCANEGRLRQVVSLCQNEKADKIVFTLVQGTKDGQVLSPDESIALVNLNYQSVAPDNQPGVVAWALRAWASDKRRWVACGSCDARNLCPIYKNHELLSQTDSGERRQAAVVTLFRALEWFGTVVTTRQALAVLAYAITGGLTCQEVHSKLRDSQAEPWQYKHLFHQTIFGENLSKENREKVATLTGLHRLDPGRVALRQVDDFLDVSPSESFAPPMPVMGEDTPRTRQQASTESLRLRNVITFLRRQDFFDSKSAPSQLERLGFVSGSAYEEAIASSSESSPDRRDQLIRGLEAAQGLQPAETVGVLNILDPAFYAHSSHAAIVAKRVMLRRVRVLNQSQLWTEESQDFPNRPHLFDVLDWQDREIVVRIRDTAEVVDVPLNLFRHELLYRWARGLNSRQHHDAETRGILSQLAPLGRQSSEDDEVTVLVRGERRILVLDTDDRVRLGN